MNDLLKTYVPSANKSVYAAVNGMLLDVKIKSVDMTLDENNLAVVSAVVTNNGKDYVVDDKHLFDSVDDYMSDTPKKRWDFYVSNFINCVEKNDGFYCYVINDGMIEERQILVDKIHYDYNDFGAVINVTSDDFPKESYASRSDALSHLDYTLVDKDGNAKLVRGASNLVALTDEQNKIMDEVKAALQKASDAGIVITVDYDKVCAFNKTELNDWVLDYDRPAKYEEIIPKPFKKNLPALYVISAEDRIFIKRKAD